MAHLAADPVESLSERLQVWRGELLNHRLYGGLDTLPALQTFMEHHVFAVWDFMSLLKALQHRLCCVSLPWTPPRDSSACRLINEIVLAEESDAAPGGGFASHFDLYLTSMRDCGAATSGIEQLLERLEQGVALPEALNHSQIPAAARDFVRETFAIIENGSTWEIAAAFTFGREDLLPDVFQRIVDELNDREGGCLDSFRYYLERHIGLDGDEHGPMATRLVRALCGADETRWEQATAAAERALRARLQLWNSIAESLSLH
jgi:hypothetical protein